MKYFKPYSTAYSRSAKHNHLTKTLSHTFIASFMLDSFPVQLNEYFYALKFLSMYRYFFRFVVMTLTILTANLITGAISEYMVSYKNHYKPFIFTFFGMAIIVLIFYPLFVKLEGWVKGFSIKAVRSGKSFAGRYLGLLMTFIIGLLILFHFYVRMWYHIDFVKVIFSGTSGGYF